MNFRNTLIRVAACGAVVLATGTTSGCGAFVLANHQQYEASVKEMRSEMVAAAHDAVAAGENHDPAAYNAARNRILRACDNAERLSNYGEAAIRSYYAQESSATVLAQLAREAYEHDCIVDGQDRLREESIALDDAAGLLRDACGCPFPHNGSNIGGTYVALGQCSLSQAVWDDFWDDPNTSFYHLSWSSLTLFPTAGISGLFISAGFMTGLAINRDKKQDYCESVHSNYTAQFRKVAALRERCSKPPPSYAGSGALDAETLRDYIDGAIERARVGDGDEYDGSNLYGDAWGALQQCNDLVARLGPPPEEESTTDIDTHVDQEPGMSDYEIPDYTPPPEPPTPPTPPGGG